MFCTVYETKRKAEKMKKEKIADDCQYDNPLINIFWPITLAFKFVFSYIPFFVFPLTEI